MKKIHTEDEPQLDQTALLENVFPNYNELIFEPGDHAEYTNVGYMALGAIIEAVSGQTYEDYVVEHIFQPLGMNHSNFVYTEEMLPDAAVGFHPQISVESVLLRFFYDDLDAFIREKVDQGLALMSAYILRSPWDWPSWQTTPPTIPSVFSTFSQV